MTGSWASCYTFNTLHLNFKGCSRVVLLVSRTVLFSKVRYAELQLNFYCKSKILRMNEKVVSCLYACTARHPGFKYLMVPVGEGRGLIRWAMLSGMFIVKGEIWGCTGFTGDSGASCFSLFSLDRAVNVILMFVLGNLKVQLKSKKNKYISHLFRDCKTFCITQMYT